MPKLAIDRRTLLVGGGIGIGLVIAFALWPEDNSTGHEGDRPLGSAIRIDRNGALIVSIPQVETGQGIWTALAQIAADEIGADWDQVSVEPAPLGEGDGNPFADRWLASFGPLRAFRLERAGGERMTAGSTSIRGFAGTIRNAAAAAREMLVAVAAKQWDVDAGECIARDGAVNFGGRSLTFGALAEETSRHSPPRSPTLRPDHPFLGQSMPRLDGPAKADGRWRFASDVRLPDMLFASARLAPPGGTISQFDERGVRAQDGVVHVMRTQGWVAVVARDWFTAERALDGAKVVVSGPRGPADLRSRFDSALASAAGKTLYEAGDVDRLQSPVKPVAATYFAAPSPPLSLDPLSATARPGHGGIELWTGTQAPGLMQHWAGDGATLFPLAVGMPSGRIDNAAAPIAIALASQLKRPVQVTLPHHVSRAFEPFSSGASVRMAARLDRDRQPVGWEMDFAGNDAMSASLGRLGGTDEFPPVAATLSDLTYAPYGLENMRVRSSAVHLPFLSGYMRGSPEREAVFAIESFIDELARELRLEPLAFRMGLLGSNPRLARCLQTAAQLAGWDGGGAGSAMGLAGASAYGSHIALVATAAIGSSQQVQVTKLVAAVDCGPVVNNSLAEQQVGAAMLWAIAQSTLPATEWRGGMALAGPTKLPPIKDTPDITVKFVPGSEIAGGLSGLGTLPVAPAIANAIAAATGKRMRNLPFDPMGAE